MGGVGECWELGTGRECFDGNSVAGTRNLMKLSGDFFGNCNNYPTRIAQKLQRNRR